MACCIEGSRQVSGGSKERVQSGLQNEGAKGFNQEPQRRFRRGQKGPV